MRFSVSRGTLLCLAGVASWLAVYPPLAADAQSTGAVLPVTSLGTPSYGVSIGSDNGPVSTLTTDAGTLIDAGAALTKYPTINGAGYSVAILDTGVDYTHPALAGRYVGGYDFVNNDSDPMDDNGHGTHVCGIVASSDATYTGIAPQAGYAALKVIDSQGSGTWANVEQGLQWVINNRVADHIVAVNLSFGAGSYNTPWSDVLSNELATLKNAGVFIAAAAGNNWYADSPNEGVAYPAADPSAVSVGAVWTGNFGQVKWSTGAIDYTTAADRVASFTDRSKTMLDLLAPGTFITSTAANWEGNNPEFVTKSGTSTATPEVAGLALLIRQAIEEDWPTSMWPTGAGWEDTILEIMQKHGVTVYDGDDENDNVGHLDYAFTRIDVLNALDYVMSVPEPSVWVMLATLAGAVFFWRRRLHGPNR